MAEKSPLRLIRDFLGSAHIFTSAIDELMREQLRAISDQPLTFSQIRLLKLVAVTDGFTVGDVAAFLGVSNAAASKAVDRLARRDLIQRHEPEEDRRVVKLSLSPEGRRLLDRYEAATDEALQALLGDVSQETLMDTAAALDRLSVRLVEGNNEGDEGAGRDTCFRCGIYFREKCLLRERGRPGCYFHRYKQRRREY